MITVLSLVFMGFVLGMRHATDPDHVVAVSTIVTRQPSTRAALLIGTMWGIGHTLTIIVVGGALRLLCFRYSAPARPDIGNGRRPDVDRAGHVEPRWVRRASADDPTRRREFGSCALSQPRQPLSISIAVPTSISTMKRR